MTTSNLDIISRAYRYLGVLRAGKVASGVEAADGLEHLQDIVNGLPLLNEGEWTEVILSSADAYEASDGERINTAGYAATITLPTSYTNDCGEVVPQKDLSRVRIIGGEQAGLYVYAASLGAWGRVDALEIDEDSPFGPEDDRGLAALLAVSLADEHGEGVTQTIAGRAARAAASFQSRFFRQITDRLEANFPAAGW